MKTLCHPFNLWPMHSGTHVRPNTAPAAGADSDAHDHDDDIDNSSTTTDHEKGHTYNNRDIVHARSIDGSWESCDHQDRGVVHGASSAYRALMCDFQTPLVYYEN